MAAGRSMGESKEPIESTSLTQGKFSCASSRARIYLWQTIMEVVFVVVVVTFELGRDVLIMSS